MTRFLNHIALSIQHLDSRNHKHNSQFAVRGQDTESEEEKKSIGIWSLHGFKFFSSSTASHLAPVPRMVILEGKRKKEENFSATLPI